MLLAWAFLQGRENAQVEDRLLGAEDRGQSAEGQAQEPATADVGVACPDGLGVRAQEAGYIGAEAVAVPRIGA